MTTVFGKKRTAVLLASGVLLLSLLPLAGCRTTLAEASSTLSSTVSTAGDPITTEDFQDTTPVFPSADAKEPLTEEDAAFLNRLIDTELAYLASLQLSNGAIPMTKLEAGNSGKLSPYFAEFSCEALLLRPEKYGETVKKYLQWHMDHLNPAALDVSRLDGTIYDYTLTVKADGSVAEDPMMDYDSTDSYAALFLKVLFEYVQATGDTSFAREHQPEVERVLNALYGTMKDDLTGAKPTWDVAYLMDNCEVYAGLVSADRLYRLIYAKEETDPAAQRALLDRADEFRAQAERTAAAIEARLWNREGGHYDSSAGAESFSWDTFYADATCQVFPVLFGLIGPRDERAIQLYDEFNAHYSTGEKDRSWETIRIPDSFPWAVLSRAAAVMGDTPRTLTYLKTLDKIFIQNGHRWTMYNAEAAHAALAADALLGYAA